MPSIHLDRVFFAYSDSVPLIQEVDLRLAPGWHGLVGANGAGKTTLLRLIAGELEPDQGSITAHPPGAPVFYCPQEVEERTPEVEALARADDGLSRRLVGQLRLRPHDLERWATLSAGERKRWQVGTALAAEPALLLLDEPTNHLDREARDLLCGALRSFGGIGLLVSHDRDLLNALTAVTIRLHEGEVRCWRGGYEDAQRHWQAEEHERREAWSELRSEQRKLERRLHDRREKKAQGLARMRTIKRTAHPKDTAATRPFKSARRRSNDASLGHEIRKLHHKIDHHHSELAGFRLRKEIGRSLFVDYVPARMPQLFGLDRPELRAGERVLLRDLSVAVQRESRIRVAGPNGIGKTTLLRALLAESRIPESRLLYLPQELGEVEEIALLDRVRALPADQRGRVLTLVAALGVAPDPLLASRRPSPGEARKLALAWGLGRRVWALVLDEPTNHLDLPSIERLEESLGAYPGALVLVTHDEVLARRCTSSTWELRDQHLHVR